MHSHMCLQACGFGHGLAQLCFGVLNNGVKLSILKERPASFVNFDEVGSLLNLLSNDGYQFIPAIRVGSVGQHMLFGVEVQSIFMTPEDVDSVATDTHVRSGDFACVD